MRLPATAAVPLLGGSDRYLGYFFYDGDAMTRSVDVAEKNSASILFPGAKGSCSKEGNIVFDKVFLWHGNYECSLG